VALNGIGELLVLVLHEAMMKVCELQVRIENELSRWRALAAGLRLYPFD
jgi:hypothetical protein